MKPGLSEEERQQLLDEIDDIGTRLQNILALVMYAYSSATYIDRPVCQAIEQMRKLKDKIEKMV